MLLYLLAEAGADAESVEFAVLGPNLFEALRRGQVVAGMVQEPALTLIVEDGGKVLFNAMDIADSTRLLGGAYEFMGVAYRAEEREERLPQMQKLARALERGLVAQRTAPIPEIRKSLPAELLVGGDGERFDEIIGRYRESLYPGVGGDRRRGLRARRQRARGRRRARARPRPRHAARHRGRAGVIAEPRPRGGRSRSRPRRRRSPGRRSCRCATSACATATPSR